MQTTSGAGLVDCDRRGTWVYYRLVPGALEVMAGLVAATSVTS